MIMLNKNLIKLFLYLLIKKKMNSSLIITNFRQNIKTNQIKNMFRKLNLCTINDMERINNEKIYAEVTWKNKPESKSIFHKLSSPNTYAYIYDRNIFWCLKLRRDADHGTKSAKELEKAHVRFKQSLADVRAAASSLTSVSEALEPAVDEVNVNPYLL